MSSTTLPGSLLFAFLTTAIAIQILIPLAPHIGLIDVKNHRKHHVGEIPLVGGIAMYFGILLSAFLLLPSTWVSLTWLFTSAGVVLLGVLDDVKDLPVRSRLIIQAIMTFILSIGSGYFLMDLGDIFGFGNVHLGYTGYLVTALAVIGAINAFNMMDGIDGLAGMMALISFGSLAVLFSISRDTYGLYVSLILLAVILPYLANNLLLPPFKHKVFMGDAGAMLIGFSVVWLLIYGSQTFAEKSSFRPVTALWVISIPLMDMAAIMLRRIRKGLSPFMPDRDHLHHILMHVGFSPRATLYIISVSAVVISGIGVAGDVWKIPESIMLISFLLLFVSYNFAIRYAWKLSESVQKI